MAERSFAREVEDLKLGDGRGLPRRRHSRHHQGAAAIRRRLCRRLSGRADLASDGRAGRRRRTCSAELGVHFETSASEAAAAAMLSASVMYPIRGAVTWKSTAGTNVASDALSNLASGGVTGGALIIIGEDYGEGSSIMQERSHAFAMKSQIWLLDPAPQPRIHRQGGRGRLRAVGGVQHAGDARGAHPRLPRAWPVRRQGQQAPGIHAGAGAGKSARATPTASCCRRPPSCTRRKRSSSAGRPRSSSSSERKLNEYFGRRHGDVGIILQGGMYNGVMRALQQLGLADVWGNTRVPLYVMNVTYPLIDDEIVDFCAGEARRADGRGRPARLHRAGAQHDPAPARHPDQDLRQGRAADRRRIHRRRDGCKGIADFLEPHAAPRAAGPIRAAERSVDPVLDDPRSRRWPKWCRRARPASAPAARSGRSSRR